MTALSVVKDHGANSKAPCSRCGSLTAAKTGICRACHNGESLPDPRTLKTEQIGRYIEALKAELKHRREAINAALEGT